MYCSYNDESTMGDRPMQVHAMELDHQTTRPELYYRYQDEDETSIALLVKANQPFYHPNPGENSR